MVSYLLNNMPVWVYLAFTMHATVSFCHFLRSSTFVDNFKVVELLFLCDVTDTISRKYYALPP